MTRGASPEDRERLDALYRERNGDPATLAAERNRPVPPPGVSRTTSNRLASFAAHHVSICSWVRRDHPTWLPDLHTLGDGEAHVIIEYQSPDYALALCGDSGPPHVAPDIAPPCSDCASFQPRSRR